MPDSLINSMEVIKKQLEKNPTPINKKDREKVIVSLIKINLVDKIFKDRQKSKKKKNKSKPLVFRSRTFQSSEFLKINNFFFF